MNVGELLQRLALYTDETPVRLFFSGEEGPEEFFDIDSLELFDSQVLLKTPLCL